MTDLAAKATPLTHATPEAAPEIANETPPVVQHSAPAKLNGIQVLRGVAAISVLVFHAALQEANFPFAKEYGVFEWVQRWGFGGVNLFFVVSGFIIAWTAYEDMGKPRRSLHYISQRVVRIYPIYWLVFATAAFMQITVIGDNTGVKGDLIATTLRAMLLIDPSSHYLVPQAWTLDYEVMFYALFFVAFFIPRPAVLAVVLLWGCAIIASKVFGPIRHMALDVMCLHFVGGIAIAFLLKRGVTLLAIPAIVVGVLWWVAAALANQFQFANENDTLHRLLGFGCGSMVLVYGVAALDLRKPRTYPGLLVRFGDASYTIYLIHLSVLWVFGRLALSIGYFPQYVIWMIGIIAVPIMLGLAIYRHIERPMLKGFHSIGNFPLRMLAVIVLFGLCFLAAMASTDQIKLTASRTYVATTQQRGGDWFLTLDGKEKPLLKEGQGWAVVQAVEGDEVIMNGWALDRTNNTTVRDILVMVDGKLERVITPDKLRREMDPPKFLEGRRPGFDVRLKKSWFTGGHCTQIVAALPTGAAGPLNYGIVDKPDAKAPREGCFPALD